MKKIEKVLMTMVKFLASMLMVELAAAIWDYCNFGYWEWTKVQDLVPAYVVLVGAAWIGYHLDNGIDMVMNIIGKKSSRKPQFIVTKRRRYRGALSLSLFFFSRSINIFLNRR